MTAKAAARRLRSEADWICTTSPWLGASVAALALLCTADLLFPIHGITFSFLAYLVVLGSLVALLHGIGWTLAFRLVRPLGKPWALIVWPLAMLGVGLWLAHDLGAFSRWNSRYANLARYVLFGCSVGGLGFGLLCSVLQPTAGKPHGYLLACRRWLRGSVSLVLAGAVVALRYADRRYYPDQYLHAHLALRFLALAVLTMACIVAFRSLPRVRPAYWATVIGLWLAAALLLDENQATTLNAFDETTYPAGILRVSRALVDWDRDGYASLFGGSDCAPWNPRIHPGAHDIPDNGIDENCVLGDAQRARKAIDMPPIPKEPAPLDVVLITVDAFGPSHIGVYDPKGYGPTGRATTPNLDRWAAQATIFEHAYTAGGWTSIAVPALLRGVYPRRLSWTRYYETNEFALLRKPVEPKLRAGEKALHLFPLSFSDPHPTLPELLHRRGMYTAAITDDGFSAMLQRGTGIERGFDVYREIDELPVDQRNDMGTANLALATLASMPLDRRFFLWVHFFGTHWPDETHPGIRRYGPTPTDAYDHEVAFLDTQLIRVLDALRGRANPVAVFLAADHGEGLNAVTRTHGLTLDEEVIRIPLFARVPGWPARRVAQLVSAIDVMPTILQLTHTPVPKHVEGLDLAGWAQGAPSQHRVLLSDTWRLAIDDALEIDLAAAYDGTRKVLLDHTSGGLYSAAQRGPRDPMRLIGTQPTDALAAAVFAYVEETGRLRLSD